MEEEQLPFGNFLRMGNKVQRHRSEGRRGQRVTPKQHIKQGEKEKGNQIQTRDGEGQTLGGQYGKLARKEGGQEIGSRSLTEGKIRESTTNKPDEREAWKWGKEN